MTSPHEWKANAEEPEVAILLEAKRGVYIEVPKVACSSIKIALAGVLGINLAADGGNPHKVRFPAPPPRRPGSTFYPGLFSFGFARNPWDRMVSCYRDKIMGEAPDFTEFDPQRGVAHCLARYPAFHRGMSFENFVEVVAAIPDHEADPHFRSQHTFLANAKGNVAVDFVGRFETLARDFAAVCTTLGLPLIALPRAQAGRAPRPYSGFYTERTRTLVTARFGEDIRLFGYAFGTA